MAHKYIIYLKDKMITVQLKQFHIKMTNKQLKLNT